MTEESIEIAKDGRCTCHCGMTCPLGRQGMQIRCTREELESQGIPTYYSEEKGVSDECML